MRKFCALLALFLLGFATGLPNSKIISGSLARKGEFPWQISVQTVYSGHICSGVLIDSQWVLAAAHCVSRDPWEYMKGVGGITNLKEDGEWSYVSYRVVHENYTSSVSAYNIALLRLNNKLIGENIQTIRLAEKDEILNDSGWVSGWGSTSTNENRTYPDDLMKVEVQMLSYEDCIELLKELQTSVEPLSETNVCTKDFGKSEGACIGDSGDPLVTNKDEDAVLFGIVSGGYIPCGTPNWPTVYVDVRAFRKWIAEQIANYNLI